MAMIAKPAPPQPDLLGAAKAEIRAQRFVAKMRGGSQAHKIEASDGNCYVVKFIENPQHRRILVNEWIATALLGELGIRSPRAGLVWVGDEFLRANPPVFIETSKERRPVSVGWHFGSRFPGDTCVYDFLPDSLLHRVTNTVDFLGILAFDKWVAHEDARQAVFHRTSSAESQGRSQGFVAEMIDHGFSFGGPRWTYSDGPLHGLYFRQVVYRTVRSLDDLDPWIERIKSLPESALSLAVGSIPETWMTGAAERERLDRLLDQLFRRRNRLGDLLLQCRNAKNELFPAWR